MASSTQEGTVFAKSLKEDSKTHHKYTDFIIVCEKQEFHVHRIVVASQSEFFDKVMSGPWKESEERCITLPDEDEASSVSLFLEILYEASGYKISLLHHNDLLSWTKMYVLADKYLAPIVREKTTSVVEELKNEYTLSPSDIAASLQLVYSPILSHTHLPRGLYQALLFEQLVYLSKEDDVAEVLNSQIDMTKDLMQFELSLMEYPYFCDLCERLICSDKAITPAKCPMRDGRLCGGELRLVIATHVKRSDWYGKEIQG